MAPQQRSNLAELSAKPYLIRAVREWCADNNLTPYLAVKVNGQIGQRVAPSAQLKDGELVLDVSFKATGRLTVDNEWIRFIARFGEVFQEIAVPITAVSGIFVKESHCRFAFVASSEVAADLILPTPQRPPALQVVK